MAISLATFRDPDWTYAASLGRRIAAMILDRGLPPKVLLNVNVPNRPRSKIQGVRVTRQGDSAYLGEFAVREDPRRQPYYWLSGTYAMKDEDPATDAWAIERGFVSVTPVTFDLTAHEQLEALTKWGWKT
jgi:5'-nucleotidase